MKKLGEVLMTREPFSEIIMGNEAVVRAMLETGTRVVTSYPGSPTPEIAAAIGSIPERPFYFEFSVNEKVATEVAYGASLNGNLSCVFFKSVGLNVALDTFVQLGLMTLPGGMVVVVGDDPGANSSQNEQDNRNSFRMARLMVLEPASPREVYTYYKQAAALARKEQTAVVLRLTTHVCHARQKVDFDGWDGVIPAHRTDFDPEKNGPYIPITSIAIDLKRRSFGKLVRAGQFIRDAGLNTVLPADAGVTKGIITAGLPFLSLREVLNRASWQPGILKLAAVNPLDAAAVEGFLKSHDEVLILEELDPILETEIKALAFDRRIPVSLIGKSEDEDYIGEYTPDKVLAIVSRVWPDCVAQEAPDPVDPLPVPDRPAQMCPGCGHRSAFHAIRQALKKEDVTVADIGCHTLGFLPPYEMGQALMCMGASPGIASGLALSNKEKRVVAFLGDSTLFHAGLPGIINTLFNHHTVTLIIMENGTTAMTGHQDHAGRTIPIRQMLEGLGIKQISECDTYLQEKLTGLVREALKNEGLSVVIARHPCMLKFTRAQQKKPDYVRRHVTLDAEACTRIHQCVETFGCPSFTRHPDGSVTINLDLCIGDGSCRPVCPTGALTL